MTCLPCPFLSLSPLFSLYYISTRPRVSRKQDNLHLNYRPPAISLIYPPIFSYIKSTKQNKKEIDREKTILSPTMQQVMEQFSQLTDEFDKNATLDPAQQAETEAKQGQDHDDHDDDDNDDDDDESVDEFEFFVGGGDLNSPVSAEEVFQNGQIRPIFPYFDENAENSEEATTSSYGPPVKKLFVVSDDVAEGPYCNWSSENSSEKTPSPAPEMSQKSNSTGFSKLWRVRDLLVRSHSDGKDAFVFLTGKGEDEQKVGTTSSEKKNKKAVDVAKVKVGKQSETVSYKDLKKGKQRQQSAYEALYGKKEKKAGKSYLPYRQDLVGFFTNSTGGLSRNVHPY